MKQVVVLFGEAEKGAYKIAHTLQKLPQLVDLLGNPPAESQGLFFAVQAILYNRELIYFRVAEEGFSHPDYYHGFKYLQDLRQTKKIHAICLPGVGDPEILMASEPVCQVHQSLLITSQKDLYDFLTSSCQA
jgi:hypothetical protein